MQPEQGIAARQEARQQVLSAQLLEGLRRVLGWLASRRAAPGGSAAETAQNVDALASLQQELEVYQQTAHSEGDAERAYMTATYAALLGAMAEAGHNSSVTGEEDLARLADEVMRLTHERLVAVEHAQVFEGMFDRYERHSHPAIDPVAQRFNQDMVNVISRIPFGTPAAAGVLMNLGSRSSLVATRRLQAKPLTPAQKSGLVRAHAQNPIGLYVEELDRKAAVSPSPSAAPRQEHAPHV